MRIAITNPTNWPYVRRGVERFINGLAGYLASRGHDVTILTGKPGRTETVRDRGFTTIYSRRLWHPALARVGLLEFHAFFFPALARLLAERYDVVFCCTFMDGYAARLARAVTGVPYVFLAGAVPPPVRTFRSLSLRGGVHGRAVRGADRVISVSEYVHGYVAARWGVESTMIPAPVDQANLPSAGPDRERDLILCAAALDDPRKGGPTLMKAFDLLKRRRPRAVLRVIWTIPDAERAALLNLVSPEHRESVQFAGTDVDVFQEYARASVSVLSSLWEAQGLVVLEALSAGTPVVGTRSGALPELISDPGVGRLFDPACESGFGERAAGELAQALDEALELGCDPETAARCRRHAEHYAWPVLGPRWEALLEQLARRVLSEPIGESL